MTKIRTASKDILARAMAMEDITVEHRADAPSAYFDTKNRVLCLPVWKDMDDAIYDMLVGHEVSHALHTPAEGWQEFVAQDGRKHMFLNCVEDARIERMIKDKFPGLRKDFASAYKSLHDQDLFEIAGKDISSLPLIDRLNLEFKLGLFGLVDVPFSADERQYVTRMAEAVTFEEVMTLADDLYELQKQEDEKNKPEQVESDEGSPGAGEDGEGQEGSTSPDADGEDESSGSGTSGAGDEGDDETDGASSGEGDESGEDSGASANDDTDDGESAESTEGENGQSGEGDNELSYDDYENNIDAAGSTQRAFERGMEEMRDENAESFAYRTLPKMILENCVVGWETITEDMASSHARMTSDNRSEYYTSQIAENRKNLQQFQNKSRPTVMHMVQQFQMKQAADADKKTSIAKTGVLDTTSMINYRWSEDIFVKNEVHADGKSHGMVMFVDWSGSMSGILQDTVEQLLVLVEFCRKAGIPYDVYAFSSNEFVSNPKGYDRYSDEYREMLEKLEERKQYTADREDSLRPHSFQLYHYLSSDMNARQYKTALQNFWYISEAATQYRSGIPSHYQLGCTPLNEAVLCAMEIVPEFQQRNGTQIVNTVFLSDGEGHGIGIRTGWRSDRGVLRDHKTRRTYACGNQQGAETFCLIECLKDKTGCNAISIRLHDSKHIKNLRYTYWADDNNFEQACHQYKKENFVTIDVQGYDKYFIVKGDLKVEFDALDNVGDDASYTRIKNAFMKGNTSKKSSRVIASQIVDIIAA